MPKPRPRSTCPRRPSRVTSGACSIATACSPGPSWPFSPCTRGGCPGSADTVRPGTIMTLSALSALAMTAIAIVIILSGRGVAPATLDDLVPALLAAAGLCVAGLTRRRAPSIAWLAIIGALTIATLDIAAWGRSNQAALEPLAWRWLVALVCVGAIFTTGSAAAYASERGRRLGGWVSWLAIIAVVVTGLVCVWVFGTLDTAVVVAIRPAAGDLGAVNRTLLAVVAGLTILGILGDLRPAIGRTRLRLDDLHATQAARAAPWASRSMAPASSSTRSRRVAAGRGTPRTSSDPGSPQSFMPTSSPRPAGPARSGGRPVARAPRGRPPRCPCRGRRPGR